MAEQVAIVTGANRGLGLETARQLAARGHEVVMAARREVEGRRAAASVAAAGGRAQAATLDVADPGSIAAFAGALGATGPAPRIAIEALVHNAGVYRASARDTMTTNVLGPMRLTDALLPALGRGARVVMVSSGMGALSGISPAARREVEAVRDRASLERAVDALTEALERRASPDLAYSVSKALLNALVRLLAPELGARGVQVNAVCPGWVRTDMGGAGAPRSVEEGAAGIVWAATLPPDGPSGGLFRDGEPIAW